MTSKLIQTTVVIHKNTNVTASVVILYKKGKYSLKGKCTLTSASQPGIFFTSPVYKEKQHKSTPVSRNLCPGDISGRRGMGTTTLAQCWR